MQTAILKNSAENNPLLGKIGVENIDKRSSSYFVENGEFVPKWSQLN